MYEQFKNIKKKEQNSTFVLIGTLKCFINLTLSELYFMLKCKLIVLFCAVDACNKVRARDIVRVRFRVRVFTLLSRVLSQNSERAEVQGHYSCSFK